MAFTLREIVPDGSSYAISVWRLSDGTTQLVYITQAEYDEFAITRGGVGEPAGRPTADAVFLMASGGMPNFTTGRPQRGDFWVRDEATREVVLFVDNEPEWHYASTVATEPVNGQSRETGNVYGTANNSYTFTLTKALLTRLRAGTLTRTFGQISVANNVVTIPDGHIKRLEAAIDRMIPNHRSATFDAATSGSIQATSLTISHTVQSVNSNRAMLAGMGIRQINITNMQYNAVTMTALDSNYWVATNDARVNGASLIAPATGTNNWVGTAAGFTQIGGAVISAYGVDQTTPVSNSSKAGSGGSTSPSVTCTSATDELVFSFLGWHRQNTSMTDTLDAGWTQITQQIGDGYLGTSGAYRTGASSVTRTDTLSTSKQWAILAYSLKAASSTVTTTQTITGTSRIQATATQTITGKARIQGTSTQTTTGTSRIQKSSTQTITGTSRIQKTSTQTITGISRVQNTATQTIDGVARVQNTSTQTITGVASIITTTTATQTITGISRIQNTSTQTIDGVSRIQNTSAQTIIGVASIVTTSNQTISGVTRIQTTASQTTTGVSRIQNTSTQTITGVSSITGAYVTTTQTITGVASITATTTQTITGVANIRNTTTKTITGVAHIVTTNDNNIFTPNDGKKTYLSEYISPSATTLIVASTDGFPTSGILLLAGIEIVTYTSTTNRSFDGLTRGAYGSVANPWRTGTTILEQKITALKTDVTTDIYANPTVQYKNEGSTIELKGSIEYIDFVGDGINATGTSSDTVTVTVPSPTAWAFLLMGA